MFLKQIIIIFLKKVNFLIELIVLIFLQLLGKAIEVLFIHLNLVIKRLHLKFEVRV